MSSTLDELFKNFMYVACQGLMICVLKDKDSIHKAEADEVKSV